MGTLGRWFGERQPRRRQLAVFGNMGPMEVVLLIALAFAFYLLPTYVAFR
ncbi:hypothetical protein [Streptomyces violascens]